MAGGVRVMSGLPSPFRWVRIDLHLRLGRGEIRPFFCRIAEGGCSVERTLACDGAEQPSVATTGSVGVTSTGAFRVRRLALSLRRSPAQGRQVRAGSQR